MSAPTHCTLCSHELMKSLPHFQLQASLAMVHSDGSYVVSGDGDPELRVDAAVCVTCWQGNLCLAELFNRRLEGLPSDGGQGGEHLDVEGKGC